MTAKRNSFAYLFQKTWHYSKGNRRALALCWGMFFVASSISIFGHPLVVAEIVNTAQTRGVTEESLPLLLSLLGLTVLIEVAFWAIHAPARLVEIANAFCVRANYREHLLRGVMTLPLEWHAEHHSGDTIDKIEKGVSGLYQFAEESFQNIYLLVPLLGSYAMLAWFSPPAGIIVALMIVLTAWITIRFDGVLTAEYKELNRAENAISESVFDAVSNISTVIILRVERFVFESIMHKVHEPFPLTKRNSRTNEWKWFLTSMCCSMMTVSVLGAYFWQNAGSAEGIMYGNLVLLIQYLTRVSFVFFQFTNIYGDALKRQARVMNAEELAEDFRSESFSNHVLPEKWQRLSIENLSYSYHADGKHLHLDDIRLEVGRGERIAFVGATGSGKTTMLKVMRNLYHPQRLSLSVDGIPIPHGFEGISRAIALVPQDPEIFAKTILGNITLGADYGPELVRSFTDMACFTGVIARLPNGLDSSIKEKGVNLSGGEQQRLALARGLLACHNKDIVLLDEPTSSLDAATEKRVYENIFREFQGKTVISSIHRLHLLPYFDRICVFQEGRIVASGTLDELLASCPHFVHFWESMRRTEPVPYS